MAKVHTNKTVAVETMDGDRSGSVMETEADVVEKPETSEIVLGNKSSHNEKVKKALRMKGEKKISDEPVQKHYNTRTLSGKKNRRQEYIYYQNDTVKKAKSQKTSSKHIHLNKTKSQEAEKLIEDIVEACKKLEKLGKDFLLIITDEAEYRSFGSQAAVEFLDKKKKFSKKFSSACKEKRNNTLVKTKADRSISRKLPLLKSKEVVADSQSRELEDSVKINQVLNQDNIVEQECLVKEEPSDIEDNDMFDTAVYDGSPPEHKIYASDNDNNRQPEGTSNLDVNLSDHAQLEAESDVKDERVETGPDDDETELKNITENSIVEHNVRYALNKWYELKCGEAKDVVVKDETGNVKYVSAKPDLDIHICQKCGLFFMSAWHLMSHRARVVNCEEKVFKTPVNYEDTLSAIVKVQNSDQTESKISMTLDKLLEGQNSPPYVCIVCNSNWEKLFCLRRHLKTHCKSTPFVCSICGTQIQTVNGFRKHARSHFSQPYDCVSCSKRFSSQAELDFHSKSKCQYSVHIEENDDGKVDGNTDFKCKTCGFQALNMTSLQIHESQHVPQKNVQCVICNKVMTRQHMKRHYLLMHQENSPFSCEVCGKQYKDKASYRRHKRLHEEKHACPKCDKVFTSKGYLGFHMHIHTNQKRYVCQHCGRGYNAKIYLDNHLRLHTGERPFKCTVEGCNKAFRSAFNLKQHTRSHCEVGQYVCDICGRTFKHPGKLNAHRKGHSYELRWPCAYCPEKFGSCWKYKRHLANCHPEKKEEIESTTNIRLHKCEICDKVYHDTEDLRRHMNNHNGVKPFVCKYCNKGFSDKSNLRTHEFTHKDTTRLKCKDCYKSFLLEKNLIAHIKRVHSKQIQACVEEANGSVLDLTEQLKEDDGTFYEIEVVSTSLEEFDGIE